MKNLNVVKGMLQGSLDHANEKIASFITKLSESPVFTIDNCDQVFEAAHHKREIELFFLALQKAEEAGESLEDEVKIHSDELLKEVVQKSTWPRRSTSVTSNFSAVCELAAKADLYRTLSAALNGSSR